MREGARLLCALDEARALCAYNAVLFDLPFIQRQFVVPDAQLQRWLLKLFDPFHTMKTVFNTTSKLNAMLALNGCTSKSGSGAEAVEMAKDAAQWEALAEYCMEDVRLTVALANRSPLVLFLDATAKVCCTRSPRNEDVAQPPRLSFALLQ
jgi:hypothetical protein